MKAIKILALLVIHGIYACNSQPVEDSIVLVNVGRLDRGEIAKEISILNSLNPKVVAIDLEFHERRASKNDLQLSQALEECKKLVLPSLVQSVGDDRVIISLANSSEFLPFHAETGFVSMEVTTNENQISEHFVVKQVDSFSGDMEYHFSVRTALMFDSLTTMDFVESHPRVTKLDGKMGKRKFKIISGSDVFNGKISHGDIEGKIVMIGFLGPGDEDKFSLPSNTNPNERDIYGVEYLANIVAQILER